MDNLEKFVRKLEKALEEAEEDCIMATGTDGITQAFNQLHHIVSSRELGVNCWMPSRFCGGRCLRVYRCNYPEKRDCKAVLTEVEYLQAALDAFTMRTLEAIRLLRGE